MMYGTLCRLQEKHNFKTYLGWRLSTISTNLQAPHLTAYKEKNTNRPAWGYEDMRFKYFYSYLKHNLEVW